VERVSTVEGKLLDRFGIEYVAERGFGGFNGCGGAFDLNGFGDGAGFESDMVRTSPTLSTLLPVENFLKPWAVTVMV
jgi:hypothetical protein